MLTRSDIETAELILSAARQFASVAQRAALARVIDAAKAHAPIADETQAECDFRDCDDSGAVLHVIEAAIAAACATPSPANVAVLSALPAEVA